MNISKLPTTCCLALLFAALLPMHAQSSDNSDIQGGAAGTNRIVGGGPVAARALANQLNDPTAPLTLIQFPQCARPQGARL